MSDEKLSYPADQGKDLVHTIAKASISAVPVVGGPIAEFFGVFVPSSLSNRRDEWARKLTDAVNALLEKGAVSVDDLRDNPNFVDAVIEATIQATKTSSDAKRERLAAAVAAAARCDVEPDRQHVFLRLIDEFTESHIRLLRAYAVGRFGTAVGSEPGQENRFLALVGEALPELAGDRSFILHLCADLANRSLIAVPPGGPRSLGGINFNNMQVTPSGTAFLKFVGAT